MTWIHYYLHYRHTAKKTRTNVSKRYTKSDSRNVKSIPNFKRATPNIEVSTTQEPQPAYTTHHALPISSSTPASDPAQIPAASEPSPHSPPSRRPMTQTATSRAVAWETNDCEGGPSGLECDADGSEERLRRLRCVVVVCVIWVVLRIGTGKVNALEVGGPSIPVSRWEPLARTTSRWRGPKK